MESSVFVKFLKTAPDDTQYILSTNLKEEDNETILLKKYISMDRHCFYLQTYCVYGSGLILLGLFIYIVIRISMIS